jgi:BlaI family transcriptional regulator, penicillinase repressor
MARKPQDVTEAELAVLQVLWERGTATIREITECLYPEGRVSEYATVKKLLARLESKECVERDRSSMVHLFSARMERQDLIGRRLLELTQSLCDGSLTPLLTHLAQEEHLTPKQQQLLRQLIDELEQKPRQHKSSLRPRNLE